jgi:transposase InsO family protein
VVESFFGTLKGELLYPSVWPTHASVRSALADYLAFYNGQRLHSTLDYRSPIEHEIMASRLLSAAV